MKTQLNLKIEEDIKASFESFKSDDENREDTLKKILDFYEVNKTDDINSEVDFTFYNQIEASTLETIKLSFNGILNSINSYNTRIKMKEKELTHKATANEDQHQTMKHEMDVLKQEIAQKEAQYQSSELELKEKLEATEKELAAQVKMINFLEVVIDQNIDKSIFENKQGVSEKLAQQAQSNANKE